MEKRAKNVETAIAEALKELNVTQDKVNIEIIEEGSKGFLGLGAKDAVIRVTLKESAPAAPKVQQPQAAAPTAEKKPVAKKAPRRVVKTDMGTPEEAAKKFLGDIFKAMDLEVQITTRTEDDTIIIELAGDNMGIVIGKRGDTLDSLQYLTSLVVNQCSEDYIKVSIDTENYREKRTEALLALSNRLAEKVEKTGRKFTLEPMNPYERRIIHSNLQDNPAVTTYSIGQEPYRKVVIAAKNAKPAFKKNGSYHKSRKPRHDFDTSERHASYKSTVSDYKENVKKSEEPVTAEKKGSYTTTYKADFKPQQHKAQYASFEEYLAAQEAAKNED